MTLSLIEETVRYCTVALDVPLDRAFTYRVPDALAAHVQRGTRAVVPWRQGAMTGIVLDPDAPLAEGLDASRVRPIADVLDARRAVPEPQLALCEWIADYYRAPIGQAVRLAAPPDGGRKSRKFATWIGPAKAPDDLDEGARRIAEQLIRFEGSVEARELIACVRGASHADLAVLDDLGLARVEYRADQGVAVRTRDRITLLGRDERHLGAAQLRVVEYLEASPGGAATDDELREAIGTSRAVIRALTDRGVIRCEVEEVLRDPFEERIHPRGEDPPLTAEQSAALASIEAAGSSGPRVVLLHGVTGSGKTEVYVRAARQAVARGERVLVLLPEIALTPQFVGVFRSALNTPIAVLHSGLSPGQRFDQWRQIRRGDVPVVIGARSALFAPCGDVGLILVDEEHDPSFKQGEGVLYHARDAAIVLAHRVGARCVLGSATPSLESLRNAQDERYTLTEMRKRVLDRPMPFIDVIDMANHGADPGDPLSEYVSAPLQARVRTTAGRGEQTILFLNRRGYAPSVQCTDCGHVLECPDCDISLTYHRRRDEVACHYCGFRRRAPTKCPTCQSENLSREGAGTEKIAEIISEGFGDLRVGRLDRDTSRGKGLTRVLGAFRRGELDLLVGTQMVTKGHDFPRVTLVGIIDADQSLRFPDFRSGERTFQLLTQVAGRAGRGELPGDVVVQTFRPDHYVIEAVAAADYASFADEELGFRQRLGYPPFGYLFALRFNGPDYAAVLRFADQFTGYLRKHGDGTLRITGPADSPIARVRNRYRIQAMVRARSRTPVRHALDLVTHLSEHLATDMSKLDVRWAVDVDAIQLL